MDEIQTRLYRLNNLLTDSERFVNQLIKERGNLVSSDEKDYDIQTKEVIENYKKKFNSFNDKFQILKDKLSRKYCQIFMYGKVSVGKSKIINAMFGKDIFHSAFGHTTSCFVKICKSSDQSHHIEYKNKKHPYDKLDDLKNKIKDMSTVFSNDQNQLETNELLTVYLNIPDNKILTSSTEIIDCPGSANEESTTEFIKNKGLHADVFIYVLTTGITKDEKTFFQYQWDKSSKPKIFFLVNKWDQAYNEGDKVAENSEKNITSELIEFLTNQLKLSEGERENRIFFVSALEICNKRIIGSGNSEIKNDHIEKRCREFETFEESLSQFIKAFIDTKLKYENELNELNYEIIKDTNQYKIDFHGKKYTENIEDLEKFFEKIRTSLEDQVKRIRLLKEDILNGNGGIKSFISENEMNLKQYEIKSVKEKFENIKEKTENKILTSQNELEQYIFNTIDEYKRVTKIELVKEKVALTEMMKEDIKLTSGTRWDKFRMHLYNFINYLSDLLGNGPCLNDSEQEKKLEENKNKINSAIHTVQNDITANINSLIDYLNSHIGEIKSQLLLKIEVSKEFLKNIENLFI